MFAFLTSEAFFEDLLCVDDPRSCLLEDDLFVVLELDSFLVTRGVPFPLARLEAEESDFWREFRAIFLKHLPLR